MGVAVFFLIAVATAIVLTPVLGPIGVRLGLVDRPGELKIHHAPIPVIGGAAVLAATFLALVLAGQVDAWVAAAGCVALGGGLIDDLRPLPPWARIVVQVVAGSLLVAGGLRLEPLGGFSGVFLVLATVACCNAVNMVDGQDGLATGLGVIAATGIASVLATIGVGTAVPLALAGALLGFLAWNWPTARAFLGDGGAYAVGVLLVASGANATAVGWHGLLAVGACLGVFAYELISTIVRRLGSAAPAIHGDRDHSYDRIGERLGSRNGATLVMWVLGLVTSLIGLAVVEMQPLSGAALMVLIVLVVATLEARLLLDPIAKEDR